MILFISTFLKKYIKKQFKPNLKKYLNNNKDLKYIFFLYTNFKTEIQQIFEVLYKKKPLNKSYNICNNRYWQLNMQLGFKNKPT